LPTIEESVFVVLAFLAAALAVASAVVEPLFPIAAALDKNCARMEIRRCASQELSARKKKTTAEVG
jgi:Na+-transporting methylmalonyl-CoA/oxaloacetate decarboxylase gamma subunit